MVQRILRILALIGLWVGAALPSAAQEDVSWRPAAAALRSAADAYEETERTVLGRLFGRVDPASGERFAAEIRRASEALERVQESWGVVPELRQRLPAHAAKGSSAVTPAKLRSAAEGCEDAARSWAAGDRDAALATLSQAIADGDAALHNDAWVTDGVSVVALLLCVLAVLFVLNDHPRTKGLFRIVPLLVFAYFVPTLLSNTGLIPIEAPAYGFITRVLLPAALVLLVLPVDIHAILGLGRNALVLFLAATVSIVIGGPLALLALKGLVPEAIGDEAWKGLAAVAGSWIGGGANYIAIGESVGASPSTMGMMVVVDVAVAEVWMIILLFFAGREKEMDAKIGADRTTLDQVRARIQSFEDEVRRPTTLPDMLTLLFLAFGVTAFAHALAAQLPDIGTIVKGFTWVVVIVTTVSVIFSFTPIRHLEGAGASKLGAAFLYLLVARIGAGAEFAKILQVPSLMLIGAVWMAFHATVMLVLRWKLKAPIFFAAVGSKANVGGAASAPILASAFHPSLAPVGVLLAIGGYVLGTYMGLVCAWLLELAW